MPRLQISENYQQYLDYLPLFLIAITTSLICTPIVGYIARKLKIIGYPPSMRDGSKTSDFRHLEKQPTPLLGGTAVIIPLIILTLIHTYPTSEVISLIIGISVLVILGILDDRYELSGFTQLTVQILVVLFTMLSPINISFINNPFGGTINLAWTEIKEIIFGLPIELIIPGDLILGLWLLISINAVKWVSGTDGLMEGNSFIAALTLFLLSVRIHSDAPALISILFAGLILGFLVFNFYPAKLRSGSPGKSTYGYLLAVLGVLSGTKLATAIIILLVPIVDFLWVIFTRIKKYKPKNIFTILSISDQNHLHHKLLNLGLTEKEVALSEYLTTAIFGVIALAFTGAIKAVLLLTSAITATIILWIITKKNSKKRETQETKTEESPEKKYSY